MDTVIQSDLTDTQKEIFNQVRLRLKLLTASDIVLANSGTRIHPDVLQGTNHRASSFQWPNVHEVPKTWIELFRSVLINIIAPKLQSYPLGKWTYDGHQRWQYYMRNKNVYYYEYSKLYIDTPQTRRDVSMSPVDILARGCKILGTKPMIEECEEPPETSPTPYQALQQAPEWMKKTWGSLPLVEEDIDKIIKTLERDKLTGGGDGSVKYGIGSHAWEFCDRFDYSTVVQGAGPVDGPIASICSFRAEATHLVAMLSILDRLQHFVKKKRVYVPIHTDSKSVIEAIKGTQKPTTKNAFKDHHDIITQIQQLLQRTKFQIEILYVKAHQDNKADLSPEEELNIRMNDLAFVYYESKNYTLPSQTPLLFPAQRVCITTQDAPLIATIVPTLQKNENSGEISDYFESKFAIHPTMQQQVHWDAIRRSFKAQKSHIRYMPTLQMTGRR